MDHLSGLPNGKHRAEREEGEKERGVSSHKDSTNKFSQTDTRLGCHSLKKQMTNSYTENVSLGTYMELTV